MTTQAQAETTITYLEMLQAPESAAAVRRDDADIVRAVDPPIHFYRYLYDAVGADYAWIDRKRLSDEDLAAIIHAPGTEIYVLYADGCPAGYAELDFSRPSDVELVFFGLLSGFGGRGFGRYLLTETINLVWSRGVDRFHVETCSLDHPAALPLYQKCGFVPFKQATEIRDLIA